MRTIEVDKNAVAVVRASSESKREVVAQIPTIVSMFLSLPHWGLGIFATGKRVNHGGE